MSHQFPYIVNLCFIINKKEEILLQKKARGFGKDNWNGPGGKVKDGEALEESVRREVFEETDLELKDIKKVAELEFIFPGDESINNHCHVYLCRDFVGEPRDKGEGELRWFKQDKIPYANMWSDDKYWLPRVLAGEFVKMRFYLRGNKVEKYHDL